MELHVVSDLVNRMMELGVGANMLTVVAHLDAFNAIYSDCARQHISEKDESGVELDVNGEVGSVFGFDDPVSSVCGVGQCWLYVLCVVCAVTVYHDGKAADGWHCRL